MGDDTELKPERWQFTLDGVELSVATLSRAGRRAPVVTLHGFGSSKEDYADFTRQEAFAGQSGTSRLALATDAAHRTIGLTWRTDRPLPAPATRFRDFVTGQSH